MQEKIRPFDAAGADSARLHRLNGSSPALGVHAIGNGRLMAYARGPELMQLFGPGYSSPNTLSMVAPDGSQMKASSSRCPGTNRWRHQLDAGAIEDCAPREAALFVRHWELSGPVQFLLDAHDFPLARNDRLYPGCAAAFLLKVPAGTYVYNDYPLAHPQYMQVILRGGADVAQAPSGLLVTLRESGEMLVAGGQDFPVFDQIARRAMDRSWASLRDEAAEEDARFLQGSAVRRAPLTDHPLKDAVLDAAEDVALLIRAQQDLEGGVQAGHNYHLAYVRDQYGVARGLLAMGCHEEAKNILRFYRGVFAQWGMIANAQGMGVPGIFHIHENDEVEITGYLLRQAMDMLSATGDEELFLSLIPMLDWALLSQLRHLNQGALPFNGDETYIAGGILPRSAINHGSFESTMLMLDGGRDYLSACERLRQPRPYAFTAREVLQSVERQFAANFFHSGQWVTNSLRRLENLTEPEYRRGVCNARCGHFGWNRRSSEGFYLCPTCFGKAGVSEQPLREEFSLSSTNLMALYTGSRLIDPDYARAQVAKYLAAYRASGSLPSRPDGDTCLGYDYGLLLYAAAECGLEADDVLQHMLSLQDETGAWVEYYKDNQPTGTKCRPWESGISIEGALRYLRAK